MDYQRGLAFFLTYFGLFNLLVLILKDQVWEVGNNFDKNSATNGINFHFIIDFAKINISLFGNVNLLLIIDGCIIVGAIALYVLIILYDKKRIQDIQGNFGSSEAAISVKNLVEKRRQKENKAMNENLYHNLYSSYIITFCSFNLLNL
ncbi:MSC_0882 family membrane protein [Mycoplasmopsis cynos]|uniref:MSC_0882 family membrane protein n=1 Tax=Mycoplasmopsis cynos TaxID=171284 RepID=UPI003A5C7C63